MGTVRRVVEAGFDPGTVDDDGHNIVINGILDATWLRQVDARPELSTRLVVFSERRHWTKTWMPHLAVDWPSEIQMDGAANETLFDNIN